MTRLPLALLALLVVALAGCGGGCERECASDDDDRDDDDHRSGEGRAAPKPSKRRTTTARSRTSTSSSTPTRRIDLLLRDELRRLHRDAEPEGVAERGRVDGLARERGFFKDTFFHRIVLGFVIQGGDPTGTGSAGRDTNRDTAPPDAKYTQGVVAMAKTATEPPGTAGSQFFVVTGADAGLPPEYAIVGKVTRGPRRRRQDRQARRRVTSSRRGRSSSRRRRGPSVVAAVVLAAGEASRFGSPKQRLLPSGGARALAQSSAREVVVVDRRATSGDGCARRELRRVGSAAPARRFAAAFATLGDAAEAAVIVLAGARARPARGRPRHRAWRGGAATRSPRATTASTARHPVLLRAPMGATCGRRRPGFRRTLVPCGDLIGARRRRLRVRGRAPMRLDGSQPPDRRIGRRHRLAATACSTGGTTGAWSRVSWTTASSSSAPRSTSATSCSARSRRRSRYRSVSPST